MNKPWYIQDLYNYDGLQTFLDLFPTYEDWVEKVGDYMIEDIATQEYAEKIYSIMFRVYRTHFIRYRNPEEFHMEIAGRLSVLYGQLEVGAWIKENSTQISGGTSTTENYKTDNTASDEDIETETEYRTDISRTSTDNGTGDLELRDRLANNADRIHQWIRDNRNLFRNKTNEVQVKELYSRGGK